MQLQIVSSAHELEDLQSDWNRLAGATPLASWEWQTSWWKWTAPRGTLAVFCVRDGGRVRAILPAWVERTLPWGTSLRMLGTGPASTDYVRLLAHPDDVSAACDVIADAICHPQSHGLSPIDLVELEGVAPNENLVLELAPRLSARGFAVDAQPLASCWRLDLRGDWSQLLQRLPSTMRRKMRRAEQRFDAGDWEFELAETPDAIERLWPDFVALHQRRFVSRGERGCFANPNFEQFLHESVAKLAERNLASLAWSRHQGEPVAAQLYLHAGAELQMYQSGVNPDFMSLEPGYTLFAWVFRAATDRGYTSFDFLRGDEPYKAQFGAVAIGLQKVRLAAPAWHSQARFRAYQVARFCKRRLMTLAARR